eukprot:2151557-Prymnesium_polylepis.1
MSRSGLITVRSAVTSVVRLPAAKEGSKTLMSLRTFHISDCAVKVDVVARPIKPGAHVAKALLGLGDQALPLWK